MIGIEAACTGRLGQAPKMRQSASGKLFATASIAVDGREGDETQWLSIVVFGETAEALGMLEKGDRVYLEGRISLEQFSRQDGTEGVSLKLIAHIAQALGKIGHRKPKPAARPGTKPAASDWQRPVDREPTGMDQAIPF